MRIIGGTKKGRRILVAKKGIRPTKGIVRDAILQVIQNRILKARVLDVFAGSGALGLEALSRGAQSCVFIEKHPAILYKNIKAIAPDLRTKVLAMDYTRALKHLQGERKFSVIFLDPPYWKEHVDRTVMLIAEHDLLTPHGVIVIEHHPDTQLTIPEAYVIEKQKRYGDSMITYLTQKGDT